MKGESTAGERALNAKKLLLGTQACLYPPYGMLRVRIFDNDSIRDTRVQYPFRSKEIRKRYHLNEGRLTTPRDQETSYIRDHVPP